MLQKWMWPALGGAVLLVIAVYAWWWWPQAKRPAADVLEQQALSAATPQERETAAVQLIDWQDDSKEHMRRVLAKSDSPAVRALMIHGLANILDYESMDQILAGLSDQEQVVRDQSYAAVCAMLGKSFALTPTSSEVERRRVIETIHKEWATFKGSPAMNEMIQRHKNNRQQT
jgi:hypothetical protein